MEWPIWIPIATAGVAGIIQYLVAKTTIKASAETATQHAREARFAEQERERLTTVRTLLVGLLEAVDPGITPVPMRAQMTSRILQLELLLDPDDPLELALCKAVREIGITVERDPASTIRKLEAIGAVTGAAQRVLATRALSLPPASG